MGFYAPAQIVRDARDHGVTVLPIDVNRSDWDCTLEPEPRPQPPVAPSLGALGLGLRWFGERHVQRRIGQRLVNRWPCTIGGPCKGARSCTGPGKTATLGFPP